MSVSRCNVADRLASVAAAAEPGQLAVVARTSRGERITTFAELEADAAALARGLVELGVCPGTRLALLVPPSPEFVALVFALLRSGATTILIDPGMGGANLVRCLAVAEPEGFVAVSRAQAIRTALRRRFPSAKLNVTVGRRWFWGGTTYAKLLARGRCSGASLPTTSGPDSAAIIFTSGSTGPAKGVLYTHEMFETQAAEIQRAYDIQPGGVDLSCFALFGLFNAAWGVTTVFPRMDFSRPASAGPRELLAVANTWHATQAFASPAVWDKLSRHCETTGDRIPSLRKVFSCGAPVHAEVLRRTLAHVAGSGAQMHTPYGATEALPVSTIEAREVLVETASLTSKGAGVCVGRKFNSIEWRVIAISDAPIESRDDGEVLPQGEIGELVVRGPQVSPVYVVGSEKANAQAKICDGDAVWHRMGDVGYLDDERRFWYCGRKAHRVETRNGPLFTASIEGVFDTLPGVRRSALVGVEYEKWPQVATPVMVIELNEPYQRGSESDHASLIEQWHAVEPRLATLWYARDGWVDCEAILFHPSLPVDVRHNAKINREALAVWAAKKLGAAGVGDDPTRSLSSQPSTRPVPPASSLQPPV